MNRFVFPLIFVTANIATPLLAQDAALKAPVANAPVANAPVANAPVANAPVANAPVANAPVANAPVVKEPVADEITTTPLADAVGKKVKVVAPRGLFAPPKVTRPLKVAVYYGPGAGEGNADLLVTATKRLEGALATPLSPTEFGTVDLSQFDIVVFAGGSGSGQAAALGETGRAKVREFVENGGGYLGICAGAYLATSGYPWSLGILNARTISSKWRRGGGAVGLELTDDGRKIFGAVKNTFPVRYNNGPVIEAMHSPKLPEFETVAYFRDELAENETPVGIMKDSPAATASSFGKGRVFTISPHFEGTKNMENFLPRALAWLSERDAATIINGSAAKTTTATAATKTAPNATAATSTTAPALTSETSTAPIPLPAFHTPLSLVGRSTLDGQGAPNTGSVFAPIEAERPLKIAIYQGEGAPDGGIENVEKRAAMLKGATVTRIKATDFAQTDLSPFDIVVFSGGSGSAQAKGLGENGREKVRQFVKNGGSYLGICAGAYLATSGYDWSLGLLNGKTVSSKWRRGSAFLEMQLSDDGKKVFGPVADKFYIRYNNGPIIAPDNKADLPPYKVEAYFRNEVALYGSPVGVQVDSPAVITTTYGKGKVLTISPHAENTKGLENFIPHGLVWLGEKSAQ